MKVLDGLLLLLGLFGGAFAVGFGYWFGRVVAALIERKLWWRI